MELQFGKRLQLNKNKRMLQRVQRLIIIKIAKAYRTISFEASCVMAGVRPIGLVIEEKASHYMTKQPRMRLSTASHGMATSYTEAERNSNTVGRPRCGNPRLA